MVFTDQAHAQQSQSEPGQQYGQQPYPPAPGSRGPRDPHGASTTTGLSLTSLILGIASIVAGFTFFVPIAGLVVGILALKREPLGRTMAMWGIVLNSVILVGAVILLLAAIAFGFAFLPFAFIAAAL